MADTKPDPLALAPATAAEAKPDPIGDLVRTMVRDTFHGSRLGRELSDRSHGEIIAFQDRLIAALREHK